MNKDRIMSVCVFGSAARKSTDNLSDRDVLIIANNKEMRDQLIFEWCNSGWSVSVYSPSRFEKMVASGSLFVQHIKLEGLIVTDRDGWLRSQLENARLKDSYKQDAFNSVFLAAPMERFGGEALIEDNLLTADLAFSSVRNFGICHFADRGRLSFDYKEIIVNLAHNFDLDGRELELLLALRPGKVSYRQGSRCQILSGTVGELRLLLSKFFPDRPLQQIDSCRLPRKMGSSYATLRDLEAWVIAEFGRIPTRDELTSLGLDRVWNWVQNPRGYSWDIRELSTKNFEIGRLIVRQPQQPVLLENTPTVP